MRRFFIVSIFLVSSLAAPALQFIATDGFALNVGQTITNECWVVAKTVEVNGTMEDDFLALCLSSPILLGNAWLRGDFHNDVWAIGRSVEFTGSATEHARFFATGEIFLDGKVGISAVAIGKTVVLTTNAVIDGDASLIGQNVVVSGNVRGNLGVFAAGAATLNGRIDGNVRIVADDIVVMRGVKIGGDLAYTSPKDLFLDPKEVELDGQLIRKELEPIQKAPPPHLYDRLVLQAYFYLCALAAGLPFIAIFSRFTGRSVRWVRQSTWKCTLVGFIAFCLIPMTSLFVLFTIIGIPLGLLLLLVYAIMIYLSPIVVALGIGGIALRRHGPQPFGRVFAALSLGLIAIYLTAMLPWIGSIAAFVVRLTGLGGMVFALFSSQGAVDLPLPPPIRQGPVPFYGPSNVSQKELPK